MKGSRPPMAEAPIMNMTAHVLLLLLAGTASYDPTAKTTVSQFVFFFCNIVVIQKNRLLTILLPIT